MFPHASIPLLVPEYIESLLAPNTPLMPPDTTQMAPTPPRSPPMFPHASIPLLVPEYIESLLAPNTPLMPPDTTQMAPTPLGAPQCSLIPLYPFWSLST